MITISLYWYIVKELSTTWTHYYTTIYRYWTEVFATCFDSLRLWITCHNGKLTSFLFTIVDSPSVELHTAFIPQFQTFSIFIPCFWTYSTLKILYKGSLPEVMLTDNATHTTHNICYTGMILTVSRSQIALVPGLEHWSRHTKMDPRQIGKGIP